MYSGWTYPWRLGRPLSLLESASVLSRKSQTETDADDRGTLTAFNLTYAEFVGRRFRLRGGFMAILASVTSLWLASLPIILLIILPMNKANIIGLSLLCVTVAPGLAVLLYFVLLRDFFTYTYYPIRFNRRTRCVYVFRDKRDGGVLTMPWKEGFFHIGCGIRDKKFLDLRCHILDGETVKDTFVTGMYYLQPEPVQQLWEFVRRYMDEGIESLGEVEVWISTAPTLMNCRIMAGVNVGGLTGLGVLLWPIALPIMLTRWLVLKTCKTPVWPPEIEAACRIDPDDPHRLPEPDYIGQFSVERELARRSRTAGRKNPL